MIDQGSFRTYLLPLLAALVFLAGACSSSDGDDEATLPEDGSAASSGVVVGATADGTLCGPMRFDESEISQASGRVNDTAKEAFTLAGLPLLAEEQWSVVREVENQVAVADPDPLMAGGSSYWVRIVNNGLIAFDGVCDFAETTAASPDGPSSCSLTADGFALTATWDGADPGAPVAVLRDGVEIHVFAPMVTSPEANDLLDARKAEHGEPVTELPVDEELAGQGGFADLEAEPNVEHTYSVQAVGSDGSRSEPLDCGQATLDGAAPSESSESSESSDLQAAATDNATTNQGPYQYVTLEPICATCDGQTVELYLVPNPASPTQHIVETVWVDGIEQAFPGPWLVDPLNVATLLLDAEASQESIAYAIDPATGIIEQWTIDGEGATLVCLEVDTRPIDLRDDRCGSSNLLS